MFVLKCKTVCSEYIYGGSSPGNHIFSGKTPRRYLLDSKTLVNIWSKSVSIKRFSTTIRWSFHKKSSKADGSSCLLTCFGRYWGTAPKRQPTHRIQSFGVIIFFLWPVSWNNFKTQCLPPYAVKVASNLVLAPFLDASQFEKRMSVTSRKIELMYAVNVSCHIEVPLGGPQNICLQSQKRTFEAKKYESTPRLYSNRMKR